MEVQARTAANRQLLADFFDSLDDHQLATRSLCSDWTVRDVLGHLVATMTGSFGGLLRDVVRARGSLDGPAPRWPAGQPDGPCRS